MTPQQKLVQLNKKLYDSISYYDKILYSMPFLGDRKGVRSSPPCVSDGSQHGTLGQDDILISPTHCGHGAAVALGSGGDSEELGSDTWQFRDGFRNTKEDTRQDDINGTGYTAIWGDIDGSSFSSGTFIWKSFNKQALIDNDVVKMEMRAVTDAYESFGRMTAWDGIYWYDNRNGNISHQNKQDINVLNAWGPKSQGNSQFAANGIGDVDSFFKNYELSFNPNNASLDNITLGFWGSESDGDSNGSLHSFELTRVRLIDSGGTVVYEIVDPTTFTYNEGSSGINTADKSGFIEWVQNV